MQGKEYFITNSRFKIILIVLFIMWCGVMILFYLKTEEVTKNPCSICAERMGEKITCSVNNVMNIKSVEFYPNYTIKVPKENDYSVLLP